MKAKSNLTPPPRSYVPIEITFTIESREEFDAIMAWAANDYNRAKVLRDVILPELNKWAHL